MLFLKVDNISFVNLFQETRQCMWKSTPFNCFCIIYSERRSFLAFWNQEWIFFFFLAIFSIEILKVGLFVSNESLHAIGYKDL